MYRVLIVGGSNSVMNPGYAYELTSALQHVGISAATKNIAVGNTNCLRGLALIKGLEKPNAFDVIVLEYFINDFALYRTSPKLWMSGYEGIVRYIRRLSPETLIVPLMLGRKDPKFHETQNKMREDMRKLARRYRLCLVDFDTYLRESVFRGGEVSSSYSDDSHLIRPLATALVANHLALHIQRALNKQQRKRGLLSLGLRHIWHLPSPMPASLAARTFEHARLRRLNEEASPAIQRVTLSNSIYNTTAIRLGIGETLEIPVSGKLISLNYVSTPDSCDLVINDGSAKPKGLHMVHRHVLNGRFRFLLRTATIISPDWHKTPAPGVVRLTAVPPIAAFHPDMTKLNEYNLFPNTPEKAMAVYLTELLEYAP